MGSNSFSKTSLSYKLYNGCKVWYCGKLYFLLAAKLAFKRAGVKLEVPQYLILPSFINCAWASKASSTGVYSSSLCVWYKSIQSICSRHKEASTAFKIYFLVTSIFSDFGKYSSTSLLFLSI